MPLQNPCAVFRLFIAAFVGKKTLSEKRNALYRTESVWQFFRIRHRKLGTVRQPYKNGILTPFVPSRPYGMRMFFKKLLHVRDKRYFFRKISAA